MENDALRQSQKAILGETQCGGQAKAAEGGLMRWARQRVSESGVEACVRKATGQEWFSWSWAEEWRGGEVLVKAACPPA
jgi:hypothetical protein